MHRRNRWARNNQTIPKKQRATLTINDDNSDKPCQACRNITLPLLKSKKQDEPIRNHCLGSQTVIWPLPVSPFQAPWRALLHRALGSTCLSSHSEGPLWMIWSTPVAANPPWPSIYPILWVQHQPDHLPDRAPGLCASIPTRHVPSTSHPPSILDPRSLFLLYSQNWPPEHQPRFSSLLVGPHVTDLTQHSSVQFSCVRLFSTPWTAAHHASLSITNFRSLLKLMSIELVMPSVSPKSSFSSFTLASLFSTHITAIMLRTRILLKVVLALPHCWMINYQCICLRHTGFPESISCPSNYPSSTHHLATSWPSRFH